MTKPLPPIVHGPITPSTPSVRVTTVASNATVDLLVAGAKHWQLGQYQRRHTVGAHRRRRRGRANRDRAAKDHGRYQ